jgi:hypothetical protein
VTWSRAQLALLLLGLCLLRQVVPAGGMGRLVLVALAALPFATVVAGRWPRRSLDLFGATLSGSALCGLALVRPQLWLQTSFAVTLVLGGGAAARWLRPRAALLAFGLGALAPLALGLIMAGLSAAGRKLLLSELGDWPLDFVSLGRFAQWLALSLAFVCGSVPLELFPRLRWPSTLALVTMALVLAPRLVWLISTLTMRTDLLIWSEPPLLLNLWKLHAGEAFYGPFSRLNSYSYSPTLEHLQYGLLRPLGFELSLAAHRVLGVVWQLLAAACLTACLARFLGWFSRSWHAVAIACVGLMSTTLLAPHLHPDHLLMLGLCGGFWLVTSEGPLRGKRVVLLLLLPALATMVKLTGAGIGLGLALVYLWERDWRGVAVLCGAGVLALLTVPLFDATVGNFSAYAIRLQASHPFDMERALAVWATPPLLCFAVALLLCALRWRANPGAPAARAALHVLMLTFGIGLTSLVAYAKHGGRDNSLLPFTLGGALALLLALTEGQPDTPTHSRPEPLYPLLAGLLALLTPLAPPVLGQTRAELNRMHENAVAWLRRRALSHPRVFSSSTAAYLDAAWASVPDMSLATISELALAKRPEVSAFDARVHDGYYDGLFLPVSSLRVNPTFVRLLPILQRDYEVVAPAELSGAWPHGLSGYVIAERRVQPRGAYDIR